ncbi:hypothetical protein GKZ28_00795 [Clostridium chromiireducens]|uniref:Uncharacterized protein n=1 Tax=Clostridium chromiireducens TaxID=225345 RepID=A0A964RIR6_9CLOT|nr:hypothetical protein [Clostridium chromiireducens]MVX62237.1 hypothetical protein [Clostridium chromiireducens]
MERFFIQSCSIDKIVEIEELLLRRYSSLDYILNLSYKDGLEFIFKAYEKELEDRLWDRWLVDYRWMNESNFVSFEDYKNKTSSSSNKNVENISKEAIEEKVKEIINLTL